jgi:dephospho-CoA kinase
MFKVGITGGIGSGKSIVCQVFHSLGIPVFDADREAKKLMTTDQRLIAQIIGLLGEGAYVNNQLNRTYIADKVFDNAQLLQSLNAIVHPAVSTYAQQWLEMQTTPYAIKEAALFFESNANSAMDMMIGVFADEELRIQRVMKRDSINEATVRQRMKHQMNEQEKMKRCDSVIINDDKTSILQQVLAIHKEILNK